MKIFSFFLGIISIFGLSGTVLFLDPESKTLLPFIAFYGSFFLFIFSFFLFFLLKKQSADVTKAVRQSILLGLLACGILFLQQWRILSWWSSGIIVFGICLLELGFSAFSFQEE
ncbi:MAG: hypothetical protein IPN70_03980 [Candidatus Moraniibacteriota bacterium]|nr:MAG: hypothetical protein IPN70_03980 [Candidatus Moranbacteria bacterium]